MQGVLPECFVPIYAQKKSGRTSSKWCMQRGVFEKGVCVQVQKAAQLRSICTHGRRHRRRRTCRCPITEPTGSTCASPGMFICCNVKRTCGHSHMPTRPAMLQIYVGGTTMTVHIERERVRVTWHAHISMIIPTPYHYNIHVHTTARVCFNGMRRYDFRIA